MGLLHCEFCQWNPFDPADVVGLLSQAGQPGGLVLDHGKFKTIEIRERLVPVIGVPDKGCTDPMLVFFQFKGTGSDHCFLHGSAFEDLILGKDRRISWESDEPEEIGRGLLERHLDRVSVQGLYFLKCFQHLRERGSGLGINDSLIGEFDILRCHFPPVVKFYPLSQVENIGHRVGMFPGCGQARL